MFRPAMVICLWWLLWTAAGHHNRWHQYLPVFSTVLQLPLNTSSAGMFVAMSNYGMENVKNTLSDIMRRHMKNMVIPKVAKFTRMGVQYEFTDLSVAEYSPPQVFQFLLTPNSPNQARIIVRGMDALILITLKTGYGNLPASYFAISMDDFDMTIALRVRTTPNHQAVVDIPVCEMSAKRALVKMIDSEGAKKFGGFAKGWIRDQIKWMITGGACNTIQTTGGTKLSQLMNRYFRMMPLTDLMPRLHRTVRAAPKYLQLDPDSFTADLIHMAKQLVFDFSMVADPQVKRYPMATLIEVPLKGEVLFLGSNPAPLSPEELPPFYENHNKMFYVTVTEYTISTLVYHLYREGYFNITLDGDHIKSPDIRYVLSSSCEDNECIGSALPELASRYPLQLVHIKSFVLSPPKVAITPYGLVITPDIRIYVFAQRQRKFEKAFVADMRFTAVINVATVHQQRLKLTSTLSSVTVRQKVRTVSNTTMAKFARMTKQAIERYFNDVFGNEIRAPRIVFGRFQDFSFSSQRKRFLFSTNFVFNRRVLMSHLQDFLQKNFVERRQFIFR